MEPLLSTKDVAKLLQKSIPAVWMQRQRGNLPQGIKIGRYIYWRQSEFEKFLEKGSEDEKHK